MLRQFNHLGRQLVAALAVIKIFRQFFCDAEHALAVAYLVPYLFRPHVGGNSKHHEIVNQVGAFLDHSLAIPMHGVDGNLDRFSRELFRHFGSSTAQ